MKNVKYRLRGIFLCLESIFFGRASEVLLPNGKKVIIRKGMAATTQLQSIVEEELVPYWKAHSPTQGEVHLDVGAQIGSYSLLAATSGAIVHAIEPDPNNRRFLRRNIRANKLDIQVCSIGAWNKSEVLSFRSHDAMSSIKGVGMIPSTLPALNQIKVDTIDNIVKQLGITKINVIKMDIEGAEIEALEGARNTIMKDHPILLIEAYHEREGHPTLGRVLALLRSFGISDDAVTVTEKTLVIVRNY
jgi:FkbM family methyltransferase